MTIQDDVRAALTPIRKKLAQENFDAVQMPMGHVYPVAKEILHPHFRVIHGDAAAVAVAGHLKEANTGEGIGFPKGLRGYVGYVIPLLIIIIYLKGYYDKFSPLGTAALVIWMAVAVLLLGFVLYCAGGKKKEKSK